MLVMLVRTQSVANINESCPYESWHYGVVCIFFDVIFYITLSQPFSSYFRYSIIIPLNSLRWLLCTMEYIHLPSHYSITQFYHFYLLCRRCPTKLWSPYLVLIHLNTLTTSFPQLTPRSLMHTWSTCGRITRGIMRRICQGKAKR